MPESGDVDALVELLDEHERVILWAGGGIVQSGAEAPLVALAEKLCAPVIETFAARGTMPTSHPLRVGAPPHEPVVAALLEEADLLVAVGSSFSGMDTKNWTLKFPRHLGLINVDTAGLEEEFHPDACVSGDARAVLERLVAVCSPHTTWAGSLPALADELRGRLNRDPRTREAVEFVSAVESALAVEERAVLTLDMAIAAYWLAGYARIDGRRRLQYPVGWGTLGYALPAAIGPSSAGHPTLAVSGDGGVMLGLGELATIAQDHLPVTVLVVDDGGYGMLRFDQEHSGAPRRGVDLKTPDFVALARAFGVEAAVVKSTGELAAALQNAIACRAPRVLVWAASLYPPRTTSARWAEQPD